MKFLTIINFYSLPLISYPEFIELVIACGRQTLEFLIQINAAPGICCCIESLRFLQIASLPIAQPLRLADFLVKQVSIQFLQTHVCDTKVLCNILQLDKVASLKSSSLMELQQVIVPGKSYFWHGGIFEQANDGRSNARMMQAEEITSIMCTHLQLRNMVSLTTLE